MSKKRGLTSAVIRAAAIKLKQASDRRVCRHCKKLWPDAFASFIDPVHGSCHNRAVKKLAKIMGAKCSGRS